MAVNTKLSYSIDADVFEQYSLADASSDNGGLAKTLVKDDLDTKRVFNSVYFFAQSKLAFLPKMFKNHGDYNADLMSYYRAGQAGWTEKVIAGAATPNESFEIDRRIIPTIILHTGTAQDLDVKRKSVMNLLPLMQLQWTKSLARAKEQLAQFSCTQEVIAQKSDVKRGYKGQSVVTSVAFPNSSRLALVTKKTNVRRLAGFNSEEDDAIDNIIEIIEGKNQMVMDQILVLPHLARRQFKKIASFRDRESTVHFGEGENGQMFKYKDLHILFLPPDAYLNRSEEFNNLYYDDNGKITSTTSTTNTGIGAITTSARKNTATALLIDTTAMCWGNDASASFAKSGELEEKSFSQIFYMKVGFGAGRMDESKVTQIIFDTRLNAKTV